MTLPLSLPRSVTVAWVVFGGLVLAQPASHQGGEPNGPPKKSVSETPARIVAFEGFVLDPDGAPAEGAVVVSSVGGKTVARWNGGFRLEASVPASLADIQITATDRSDGRLVATTSASLLGLPGLVRLAPLWLARGSACVSDWLPTFGAEPGANDDLRVLVTLDDGNGAALYAAGDFTSLGGARAGRIARWNGSDWASLGEGSDIASGYVAALAVFDDGGGPALYAGGSFQLLPFGTTYTIAKWDGSSWSVLGPGLSSPPLESLAVAALAVFDDGSGPALYVGGSFRDAGATKLNRIGKWDGTTWTDLNGGIDGSEVSALAVFDDGGGPALFAAGAFQLAGGVSARRIAKWDGASWTALAGGLNSTSILTPPHVHALATFDDGTGPALYAGGYFTRTSGVTVNSIAKWNGSSWAPLGTGVEGGTLPRIRALTVWDDGTGPALHAGGHFTTAGGLPANKAAKWDGSSWAPLGAGMPGTAVETEILALQGFDGGSGSTLFAGGSFTFTSDQVANRIATWNGAVWGALGTGLDGPVLAVAVFDDGGGPALYAGGSFEHASQTPIDRIAKWDGSAWTPLGAGTNGPVRALEVFDDGGGPALYVGGDFSMGAGGIAKWDGSGWSTLGSGVNGEVWALEVFDDGGGPALFVGGDFTTAGGLTANRIAKWNGSSWIPIGLGFGPSVVSAMAVFDDGTGSALFVGGDFTVANGMSVGRIVKWDGSLASALLGGVNTGPLPSVLALAVFDDGGGAALHVGGTFQQAGGMAVKGLAKWDGSSWSPLGDFESSVLDATTCALSTFDDGQGPALYVGGEFTTLSGLVRGIAKWDGSDWSAPLGASERTAVKALAALDDGSGPALLVGGTFPGGSGDSFLAKWVCAPDVTPPSLTCPPFVVVVDRLDSAPGETVTFSPTATDDHGTPDVVCVPPSGSFFPRGTTIVTCTATDGSGNQSTCQFPVTVEMKARRR